MTPSAQSAQTAPAAAAPTKLTIRLTDRPPVTIVRDDWPTIASAKDWDNRYESQANRTWHLKVRQHIDGRSIVYGWHTSQYQGATEPHAGELLAAGDDIVAAIHRVAADCDCESIAQDCIQDLPAEQVNGHHPAAPLAHSERDLDAIRSSLADLAAQLTQLAQALTP